MRAALSAAAIRGASTESVSGLPNSENLRGDSPRRASTMLSCTVSVGNRLVIWKVREMPSCARRCGGSFVYIVTSNMIRPLVGGTIPVIALNSVVLPAPLGPMMARRWPRGTDRLTPSTARSASKATTASVNVRIGSDTNISVGVLSDGAIRLAVDMDRYRRDAAMDRARRQRWIRPS